MRKYIYAGDMERCARERFWKFVDKNGPNGCWLWTGVRTRSGHGRFTINHKFCMATRYSMFLVTGKWPDNYVLHKCNNPPCVNPGHLYEGTISDNSYDYWRDHQRGLRPSDMSKE